MLGPTSSKALWIVLVLGAAALTAMQYGTNSDATTDPRPLKETIAARKAVSQSQSRDTLRRSVVVELRSEASRLVVTITGEQSWLCYDVSPSGPSVRYRNRKTLRQDDIDRVLAFLSPSTLNSFRDDSAETTREESDLWISESSVGRGYKFDASSLPLDSPLLNFVLTLQGIAGLVPGGTAI